MAEYKYDWNFNMASKSNMAAIMKSQFIMTLLDGNVTEITTTRIDYK